MDLLNQLSPGEIIAVTVGAVLAFCGAVNTVGAAVERVVKLRQTAKAPDAEQDRRLTELERWRTDVDAKLGHDFVAFRQLEESTAVTQRALLALLGHGLHGNNIDEMSSAEKELKDYLTNHH